MKLAVLSDIHSNAEALDAVVQDTRKWGAESYLVAGDIVGYGASPNECISIIKELGAGCVAGNHDWGVLERTSVSNFNRAAREAVLWTREKIGSASRTYLESLPLTLEYEGISLVHANFTDPDGWDYVFTLPGVARELDKIKTPIGIIGHSHVPFVTKKADGWPDEIKSGSVHYSEGERFLVNVGSVGQPRDYDPRACYLRVDTESLELALRRIEYDIESAQRKILDAGLPSSLAERLAVGQ